jgi:hypothetical protein
LQRGTNTPWHGHPPISPAQNVLFWCSIGHYSYDKIADQSGGSGACCGVNFDGHIVIR